MAGVRVRATLKVPCADFLARGVNCSAPNRDSKVM